MSRYRDAGYDRAEQAQAERDEAMAESELLREINDEIGLLFECTRCGGWTDLDNPHDCVTDAPDPDSPF